MIATMQKHYYVSLPKLLKCCAPLAIVINSILPFLLQNSPLKLAILNVYTICKPHSSLSEINHSAF